VSGGVKTGECGIVSERGGDAGVARALEAAADTFSRLRLREEGSWTGPTRQGEERFEAGWAGRRPRPSGEGGRWLGLGEEGGPREEEGEWA
jgi:hypothetical protein